MIPASEAVERRSGLDAVAFHAQYMNANRPVVLTDEVTRWPAARLWTDEYLTRRFGDKPVSAHLHGDGIYTGHGVEIDRTTLEEVLRDTKRRSLVVHVLHFAPYLIPDYSIPTVLDEPEVESSGFWIKPNGATSGLHFDHQDGLLGVVRGKKRILLFSPDQYERLYPCPLFEVDDSRKRNWSSVRDVFAPSYDDFPRLAEASFHEVVLEAGEMLFIPKYWWHAVEHRADVTISINFFLRVTHEKEWPVFYHDRVFIERLLTALR